MTYEESKRCIMANICYKQECCSDGICKSTEDRPCAIEVAIESIEKQIPKKPTVVQDSWYVDVDEVRIFDIFHCPTCNEQVNEINEQPYCWKCSQRIDWIEEE